MKGYDRRDFVLQALVACGTAFLVPSIGFGDAQGQQTRTGAGEAAAGYFGHRLDAARAVGTAYLKQLASDTTAPSILAATRGTTAIIEGAVSQREAIEMLVAAVRQDFREGRSVQVEGWILSRTEAELCALTLLPATN
jgi:hypothetical protein